jgi:hypothetical protein
MTLTLAQIKNAELSITKLLTSPLPVRISYRLSKVVKIISTELQQFEELRQKLVEKYGEVDSSGMVTVTQTNQPQFLAEINGLLDEVIEFPDVKINLDDLGDVKLSAVEMTTLEPWISETE